MLMPFKLVFFMIVFFVSNLIQAQFKIFVTANKDCETGGEAFISQNKKIVYQLPVFQNIDSTVYLNKGNYTVAAVTKECEFQENITIEDGGKPTAMTIALKKVSRQRIPSSAMSPERAYTYGLEVQLGLPPGALNTNYMMPAWYPYANQQFSNYTMPCMWSSFGCNSMYYPTRSQFYPPSQSGPIMMGKPNVYVRGPDAKNLQLLFLKNSENRFMASTPSINKNYWEFDLQKNSIYKNDTQLGYLFFDARTPSKADYNLDRAFCGVKSELLKFMIEQLDRRQFPDSAMMDFKQHWAIKLPDIDSCIFPQTEKQIQSFFPLELRHQEKKLNSKFNRIYFVVVPKNIPSAESPMKFKAHPKKWTDTERNPASAKSTVGYQVFEWGVGFIAN
jgi:hypothetical protein